MLKLNYEVGLNEDNRPIIKLPKNYKNKVEDKFFALEFSRYIISIIFNNRPEEFTPKETKDLNTCLNVLGQLSDELSKIIYDDLKSKGLNHLNINKTYHIQVANIGERNKLNYNGIIYNDTIYSRTEGLKVLVADDMKIYELVGGIDNENWKEI